MIFVVLHEENTVHIYMLVVLILKFPDPAQVIQLNSRTPPPTPILAFLLKKLIGFTWKLTQDLPRRNGDVMLLVNLASIHQKLPRMYLQWYLQEEQLPS